MSRRDYQYGRDVTSGGRRRTVEEGGACWTTSHGADVRYRSGRTGGNSDAERSPRLRLGRGGSSRVPHEAWKGLARLVSGLKGEAAREVGKASELFRLVNNVPYFSQNQPPGSFRRWVRCQLVLVSQPPWRSTLHGRPHRGHGDSKKEKVEGLTLHLFLCCSRLATERNAPANPSRRGLLCVRHLLRGRGPRSCGASSASPLSLPWQCHDQDPDRRW